MCWQRAPSSLFLDRSTTCSSGNAVGPPHESGRTPLSWLPAARKVFRNDAWLRSCGSWPMSPNPARALR